METKTLSKQALDLIEQYSHFQVGKAVTNIPYFNNRKTKSRASFRVHIGKGSPSDIHEEVESIIIKEKIDKNSFTDDSLKKILVDNNLGIECSGLVYHILEAESQSRKLGTISKNINFINCHGFVGQLRCTIRPVENCDVETFANNANSKPISISEVKPSNIITMLNDKTDLERNHILLIKDVQYENNLPKIINYIHSVAYPEDGLYGTGVRQGTIDIINPNYPITEQNWIEENNQGENNKIFVRAKKSLTEIRHLNFF